MIGGMDSLSPDCDQEVLSIEQVLSQDREIAARAFQKWQIHWHTHGVPIKMWRRMFLWIRRSRWREMGRITCRRGRRNRRKGTWNQRLRSLGDRRRQLECAFAVEVRLFFLLHGFNLLVCTSTRYGTL